MWYGTHMSEDTTYSNADIFRDAVNATLEGRSTQVRIGYCPDDSADDASDFVLVEVRAKNSEGKWGFWGSILVTKELLIHEEMRNSLLKGHTPKVQFATNHPKWYR